MLPSKRPLLLSVAAIAFTLSVFTLSGAPTPADKSMTYPQLVSTQFAGSTPLPADAGRPGPARFDFVDAAKLPPGAKVLSAARTRGGAVWVVTDQGPFSS